MESLINTQMPVMMSPSDWQGLARMNGMSEDKKLQMTSDEFEATLVREYLKEAMKPMVKGFISESGVAQDIYRGFLTDTLAGSITRGSGGLGISSVLQSQLTTINNKKETHAS